MKFNAIKVTDNETNETLYSIECIQVLTEKDKLLVFLNDYDEIYLELFDIKMVAVEMSFIFYIGYLHDKNRGKTTFRKVLIELT